MFGLLKRRGKVYAVVIAAAKATTVLPMIRETVKPDSLVSTEGFKGDNAVDVSDLKHDRIHHRERCVERPNHSNGLEKVWNQAKRHLRKVNGIARAQVHLYLKECAWRLNNSDPKNQLMQLNQWVKQQMG